MNDERRADQIAWFQISIQDVLLLTLIIAIVLGWWCNHQRLATQTQQKEGQIWALKQNVLAHEEAIDREGIAVEERIDKEEIATGKLRLRVIGRVVSTSGDTVDINLGSRDGLEDGDELYVYRYPFRMIGEGEGLSRIGRLRAFSVREHASSAKVMWVCVNMRIEGSDRVVLRRPPNSPPP